MTAKKQPQKTIQDAYRDALARYGHRQDVTGIDVGYKYQDGRRTEVEAVRTAYGEHCPIDGPVLAWHLECWQAFWRLRALLG